MRIRVIVVRGGVTVKSNVLGADARRGVQISFPGPVVTVIDDVIIGDIPSNERSAHI